MKSLEARLLSGRNQLSRIEKEAILESVLDRVALADAAAAAPDAVQGGSASPAPRQPDRRRLALWLGPPLGLAAASLLGFLLLRPAPPQPGELTARGGSELSRQLPDFAPRCIDAQGPTACRPGRRLLFVLRRDETHPYFAAYAEHPDGTRLWYLPDSASGQSVDLRSAATQDVLSTTIVLGSEHRPGRYRIHGVFSQTPLSRAEVQAAVSAGDSSSAKVRTQDLLLAPPTP